MKNNFLTIPDAPDYEINSDCVVRKKSNGRILKTKLRVGKTFRVATLFHDGKKIKRDVETFRYQAVTAFKDSKLKHDDWWLPIPSLDNLYEINQNGKVRNANTKRLKTERNGRGFRGYVFSINGKSIGRSTKNLLWEVHGKNFPLSHCTPVPATIKKDVRSLYFATLADLARFLAKAEDKLFSTVYRRLRDRPINLYGWTITYHKAVER